LTGDEAEKTSSHPLVAEFDVMNCEKERTHNERGADETDWR
jgi:hypothetical protein